MQKQIPDHTPAVTWEERVDKLECLYETEHPCEETREAVDRLFFRILGRMGAQHADELRVYTDLLAALYNKDVYWFYLQGLHDGAAGYRRF